MPGDDDRSLPTFCNELCNARAGFFWNVLCCPLVTPISLLFKSIIIYVFPCATIIWQRIVVGPCCGPVLQCCLKCCWPWPYEDKSFYGAKALGDHPRSTTTKDDDDPSSKPSASEMEKDTVWIRAENLAQFKGKRPQLFQGEISPNDLCQGAVGDCWLVAAFACASEYPDMIRHMFLTKEYNPRGLYKVRIYSPQKKKWVIITVDDRIPCKKGTNRPRFMKPNGNELWAIILEKAYAKFCGSYARLNGGFALWGWHSMTGDNVFQLSENAEGHKNDGKWSRENVRACIDKKDPNDKRACAFYSTEEKYDSDQIWILLKKYDKQKALITASIGKTDYRKNQGPSGEQYLEREGLVAGHAYSVIDAVEVKDKKHGIGKIVGNSGGDTSFRLMRLRNPWGTYEWKGNWSDRSELWKKHESIAKQLNFEPARDGSFWMEYKDFKKVYTRINICDRDTHRDASLDANEDDGSCGIVAGFCCGCMKFWCLCQGFRNLYCSHESTKTTLEAKEKACFIC